ncbi:hypothetical protein ABIC83_003081 [Roseateles asaccharophilus]|uniref:hypothetical protein n=1 Tax=Roseateles asaccharophilus TaxID=582607 RepID=UPI0038352312
MTEAMAPAPIKKPRKDGQMSGLAGEFFVAAELLKRGLQTSVTFGNAKSVDLLALHPLTGKTFVIQVKTLRSNNYYLLWHEKVEPTHVYVFVLLNRPGQAVRYFIVPGHDLKDDQVRFGKGFFDPKMPGIQPKTLQELGYEDAWEATFGPAAD